jgi:hypothetical protein
MQPDAPEAREGMRSSAENSSGWGETSGRTFFQRWMEHLLLALPCAPIVPPIMGKE